MRWKLRVLEEENQRLKHMIADLTLDNHALKAVIEESFKPRVRRTRSIYHQSFPAKHKAIMQADGHKQKHIAV